MTKTAEKMKLQLERGVPSLIVGSNEPRNCKAMRELEALGIVTVQTITNPYGHVYYSFHLAQKPDIKYFDFSEKE